MNILIKPQHPEVKVPERSQGARSCSLGFNQVRFQSSNFFLDRNMSLGVQDFHWREKKNTT